jgi:hypothetical protein
MGRSKPIIDGRLFGTCWVWAGGNLREYFRRVERRA